MKLRSLIALALALSCAPAMAQTNQGSSPLTGPKGGTNNAWMQFAGPASSVKTYTLPNVTGTLAMLSQIQTWTGAQSFSDGTMKLLGSTSGAGTIKAPAAASAYVWTLPAATGTIAYLGNKLSDFASTTSAELIGVISDETGSGALVFGTSPTLVTPNLGTPSAATLTNATGLPVGSGISGLGTGIASWLATPSSANLLAALTDETGAGAAVFANGPTLIAPALGTPASGTLTNATGLPIGTGVSGLGTGIATALGTPSSANFRAAVTDETGTGAMVFGTSPTLASPAITTPTGIIKADVGLGNVDNTSDLTKWGATKTLTNTTFACNGTGNSCVVRIGNDVTGLGTGIAAALAINTGSAGAPVLFNGAGGTPSSMVGTNITGTAAGLTAGNVTTNANLTGEVTSVGNATTVTNASVIAKLLTAFASGAGTVTSSDSILTAFQKVVGNIALKADIASPALTGTPAAPTAAADTNTTQIATTAFVIGQKGTANPLVNGTAAPGTSPRYAPQDHVHPTDTSRAAAANSALTGTTDAQGTLKLSSFVTSTQLTANANDYTATDGSNTCSTKGTLRISTNASRNISGLSCGQAEGDLRVIHNVGAFPAVLTNADAGSSAANRFLFGGDLTLAADSSIMLRWDGVTSRWRAVVSPGAGGGGGSGAVTLAAGSGITVSGTCTSVGTATGTCTISLSATITAQHRITLASGVPVMNATSCGGSACSGQGTVYVTPAVGNLIPIYDGTTFTPVAFPETSQTTTDTTKSPAAVAASSIYDVFCWLDGATPRCTRGPPWTSDTARSGGTALTRVNGVLLNNASIANGPAAQRGTYVGSIRSNGSATIDYVFGSPTSGGGAATFNVWNLYNRAAVGTTVTDSGANYGYNGGVRQARASAGNQINFLAGLAEDSPVFTYTTDTILAAVTSAFYQLGIGYDATNAISGTQQIWVNKAAVDTRLSASAVYSPAPPLGFHFAAGLERADGTNSNTFNGASSNSLIGQLRQ